MEEPNFDQLIHEQVEAHEKNMQQHANLMHLGMLALATGHFHEYMQQRFDEANASLAEGYLEIKRSLDESDPHQPGTTERTGRKHL